MNTEAMLKKHKELQDSQNNNEFKSNIPFAKWEAGKYDIRFLPVGNKQEKIPYKSVMAHTIMIQSAPGQRAMPNYALCYQWLFQHTNAEQATIVPLNKMGKLKKVDAELFSQFGCPACRAHEALRQANVSKEDYNRLRARGFHYWNILKRADKKIYVWSISDTQHKVIDGTFMEYMNIDEKTGQAGKDSINIFDSEKGYDWTCGVVGSMLTRRYELRIKPRPCSIGEIDPESKPIDLMEVVAESFKGWAVMEGLVQRAAGDVLQSIGYRYAIAKEPVNVQVPKSLSSFDDDDEDEKETLVETKPNFKLFEEEEEPETVVSKMRKEVDPPREMKKKVVELEEDEDDDEEEVPLKKLPPLPPKKQVSAWDDDDEDEDSIPF